MEKEEERGIATGLILARILIPESKCCKIDRERTPFSKNSGLNRSKRRKGDLLAKDEDRGRNVWSREGKRGAITRKRRGGKDARARPEDRRGFYLESRFRPISDDVSSTRK